MVWKIALNIIRFVVALTFLFSGFVKAVDPLGTQYKLQDYAEAIGMAQLLPDWLTLASAVLLAAVEFVLGLMLLMAISRRMVTRLVLTFMTIMTLITVWIYIADPVSDCGCFGDAIVLTNGQTLLKNVFLTAGAALLAWRPLLIPRFVSLSWQWMIRHTAWIFIIGLSLYCLYYLPILDFRPYHIGANIREGMEIPEGAEQTEFETIFIMEKNGQRREFSLDDYPDSTWTFIDSKTKVLKQGYVPPIHDFFIQRISDGEDITDQVLDDKGYTLLLISPHLEKADDTQFGSIELLYEEAMDRGYAFYSLTASGEKGIAQWQEKTGAEYTFCNTDEVTLKTIIRSNPGLVLLKHGTVVGKWSHNALPTVEELAEMTK